MGRFLASWTSAMHHHFNIIPVRCRCSNVRGRRGAIDPASPHDRVRDEAQNLNR